MKHDTQRMTYKRNDEKKIDRLKFKINKRNKACAIHKLARNNDRENITPMGGLKFSKLITKLFYVI